MDDSITEKVSAVIKRLGEPPENLEAKALADVKIPKLRRLTMFQKKRPRLWGQMTCRAATGLNGETSGSSEAEGLW